MIKKKYNVFDNGMIFIVDMTSKGKNVVTESSQKKKKERDIGWNYGERIGDNRQHVMCNFCHKKMMGGGVSRLKQHLAGGYNNVEQCDKCPIEIARAMRDYLNRNKTENAEVTDERRKMRQNLIGGSRRRSGIEIYSSDENSDDDMDIEYRADIEYAKQQSIRDIHMAEQGFRGGSSRPSIQKGGTSRGLMRSHSVKESWDKFSRKSQKLMGKEKDLTIEEMDPSMYRNREVKQAKLTHMWNPKKWAKSAKHAIAKYFIYENIPPSKAQGHFYQLMIDEIALAGVGVKGPTPYEIGGPLLDNEIDELKEYIDQFKKKWEIYGVTIMCDGWTSTTRLSIINFLIYCDGKVVFHKSIDSSGHDKDANYILGLMDAVVEEIGEKYVVQIITDNGSAYKKAGEMLMERRPHLYWTPCAAHSLDLILHDFSKIETVQNVLEQAKRVTNFIYNHNRVLDIMRTFCSGELIRPGQTRFATNYLALQSILEQKNGLQRMFTSEDWSRIAAAKDPIGKRVQGTILNPKFWETAKNVLNMHTPIARVLRMVDEERKATMPYVYEAMKRARQAVKDAAPKSCKKYLDIIDARWKKQIIQHIHMAGKLIVYQFIFLLLISVIILDVIIYKCYYYLYCVAYYLNPTYHYEEDVGVLESCLGSLRIVVSRLETNPNKAAEALAEVIL